MKPQSSQTGRHQGHALKPMQFFLFNRLLGLVCCFPIAAVTNHPKFSSLKQHKFIVLQFLEVRSLRWVSLGWNQASKTLHSFLEVLRENLLCLPFPASSFQLPEFFCLWPPSNHQSQQWLVESFSYHIILTLTLLPLSFTSKYPCDYSEPNQ